MKTWSLAIALAIFGAGCNSEPQIDTAVWKDFSSAEAGLKASFPCEPKSSSLEYEYKVGKRYGYSFTCEFDGLRFQIMFGDHNPETGESVATFLRYAEGDFEGVMGRDNGVRKKELINLDGFDAYRYEIRTSNAHSRALICANEKGALQMYAGPFGAYDSLQRNRAERFIESIHFIK